MKVRGRYVIAAFATAAAMALALLIPLLALWPAGPVNDDTVSDAAPSLADKIRIVTIVRSYQETASSDYYKQELNGAVDMAEASEQYLSAVDELRSCGVFTDATLDDLAGITGQQAVNDYFYYVNGIGGMQLRVIGTTYYETGSGDRLSLYMGLDKDTGKVVYLYLNVYNPAADTAQQYREEFEYLGIQWAGALGMEYTESTVLYVSGNDGDAFEQSYTTTYKNGSDSIAYRFGLSQTVGDETHLQIYLEPQAG